MHVVHGRALQSSWGSLAPVSNFTVRSAAAAWHLHGLTQLWQKAIIGGISMTTVSASTFPSLRTLVVQDLSQSMKEGEPGIFPKAQLTNACGC